MRRNVDYRRVRETVPYPIDELPPDERLDPDAPLEFAMWQGEPVAIARRDPRITGRFGLSVPISISRLRRALDIEADRATGPYVRSAVETAPLYGISAEHPRRVA